MKSRYNLENLLQALQKPSKFVTEAQRLSAQTIGKRLFYLQHGPGDDIMEKDWDNLLLLDACRYDIFKKINYLDGELDYIISKGSQSEEFCEKTFQGQTFHDTVYVTANPYGARLSDDTFHDTVVTFGSDYDRGHSDGRAPKTVKEAAIEAHRDYPNKRLLVHFMQPHGPYIGPMANELRKQLRDQGVTFEAWESDTTEQDSDQSVGNLMHATQQGYITREQLKEVYVENLEVVLEDVEHLVGQLNGKTVISSDHGELLGERKALVPREFSHPKNAYASELRKVPWFVFDTDDRRTITAEPPVGETDTTGTEIEEELKALGYLD